MNLTEMSEITEAATSGPWEYIKADDDDDWMLYNPITTEYIKQDDSGVPISDENGKFIAMARNKMEKLIAVTKAAKNVFPGMLCDELTFVEGAPLDGCKTCILGKALEDLEKE